MLGTITTGTILSGRYEILRFLGQGGFAETYVAKDQQMPFGMQCVVKRLKPQATDSATLQAARVLFDREAKVLYQLGHHNQIPGLLAHFEENQEFYLLEDYIDGEDLEKNFAVNQPWTEPQIIDLLKQVLEILAFVHKHHVIHRDIKPSNLIQRKSDGKIVLLDFGAVKQVYNQVVTVGGHTNFVVSVGSSGYIPNEQQGGKPRYSSDIYALGMTAIHALTGKSPDQLFEDPETGEVVWRLHAQQVSHKLAAILDKMVRVHFRDRYQTVEEVLKDLQSVSVDLQPVQAKRRDLRPKSIERWRKHSLSKLKKAIEQSQISFRPGYFGILITVVSVAFFSFQLIFPSTCEPDVCIEEGIELVSSGKYNQALAKFKRVPTDKLDNKKAAQALIGQGVALYFLGEYYESLTLLEKAGELNPNNAIAWEWQAKSLYNLERYEEAVNAFDKALGINPNNSYLWSLRAEPLAELRQFDEAFDSLDRATNENPLDPTIWKSKGFVLYQLEKYSEALYAFEESINNFKSNHENRKNNPNEHQDYADTWFGKGKALKQLNRYEEALNAYNKTLKLNPYSQEAKEAQQELAKKMGL